MPPPSQVRRISQPVPQVKLLDGQTVDVLDRITSIDETPTWTMSLYGDPGTGKTRLACTFPKPLLIIGTEYGTDSVIGVPGIDFVLINKCDEITPLINHVAIRGPSRWKGGRLNVDENGRRLPGNDPYSTVVLDSASRYRDMRIAEIKGVPLMEGGLGHKSQSRINLNIQVTRDDWTNCMFTTKQLIGPLIRLGKEKRLKLVFISHEQNLNAEENNKPQHASVYHDQSMSIIKPKVGPSLGKGTSDWLQAECNYNCRMVIREEVLRTREGIETKTGKSLYSLRVGPDSIYQIKFRLPVGRELKQDWIDDPSYDKIKALLEGK